MWLKSWRQCASVRGLASCDIGNSRMTQYHTRGTAKLQELRLEEFHTIVIRQSAQRESQRPMLRRFNCGWAPACAAEPQPSTNHGARNEAASISHNLLSPMGKFDLQASAKREVSYSLFRLRTLETRLQVPLANMLVNRRTIIHIRLATL